MVWQIGYMKRNSDMREQWLDKNSDAIVFVKFDESQVPEMYIPIYWEKPLSAEMRYKYPKAGARKTLWFYAQLYRIDTGKTAHLNLGSFKKWLHPDVFRPQKRMRLF